MGDDNLSSPSAVRRMSNTEINNLNKADLKKALLTLRSADCDRPNGEASLEALHTTLQQQITEMRVMNHNFNQLSAYVNQMQSDIVRLKDENTKLVGVVAKQQSFLEDLDFQQRACNMIITGLNETESYTVNGETANTDDEKINLILRTVDSADVQPVSVTRLGQQRESRIRPLKVVFASRENRTKVLRKSASLKASPALSKVFMKQDTHPAYREEWRRLNRV